MKTDKPKPKCISKSKHLQVVGLLVVAQSLIRQLRDVEIALCQTLNVEIDESAKWPDSGHVGDAVYSDYSAGELLSRLNLKVRK